MTNINTVLFDFDGTIMNTAGVIIESWKHVFKTLKGEDVDEESIVKTFGEPLVESLRKAFPDVPVEEAIEIYRSNHLDSFTHRISLFPGMDDLLAELYDRKYKMAVVTSRTRKSTYDAMEKFGLEKYFGYVVTCDDTDKHKPDPTPIFIALDKLSRSPERSIMVGDTMFDILAAKGAGVKSGLVGWSISVDLKENKGPLGPDHRIEKPFELFDLL